MSYISEEGNRVEMPWCQCPNCLEHALDLGGKSGIDCPTCGLLTFEQLLDLEQKRKQGQTATPLITQEKTDDRYKRP